MLESWQYAAADGDGGGGGGDGDGDGDDGDGGGGGGEAPSPRSLSLRTVDLVDAMLLCDDDGDIGGEEMPWEEGW
jgi:hypothetical protein